jgi:hypothetical protein
MRHITQTHTFATLEVSQAVFDEIAAKLREAGYDHSFVDGLIDMHGIALERTKTADHEP